jgi:hypothetical protein
MQSTIRLVLELFRCGGEGSTTKLLAFCLFGCLDIGVLKLGGAGNLMSAWETKNCISLMLDRMLGIDAVT